MSTFRDEIKLPFTNPAAYLASLQSDVPRRRPSQAEMDESLAREKERQRQTAAVLNAYWLEKNSPPVARSPRPPEPSVPLPELNVSVTPERVAALRSSIVETSVPVGNLDAIAESLRAELARLDMLLPSTLRTGSIDFGDWSEVRGALNGLGISSQIDGFEKTWRLEPGLRKIYDRWCIDSALELLKRLAEQNRR